MIPKAPKKRTPAQSKKLKLKAQASHHSMVPKWVSKRVPAGSKAYNKTFFDGDDFLEAAESYLGYCEKQERVISIIGFAVYCGIHKEHVLKFGRANEIAEGTTGNLMLKRDLNEAYKRLLQVIEATYIENAINGTWKEHSCLFFLRCGFQGYKDEEAQDSKIQKIEIVNAPPRAVEPKEPIDPETGLPYNTSDEL